VIEPVSSLDAKVDFLLQPESYPEPTLKVEAVETHMSWVFLTDQFAYKLKKPAKTSFLDFSTVELRRHFCEEEVRLNQRLAPAVYLSTVAITRRDGEMVVGGDGPAIDWLVKMRRLPRDRMLDQAIRNHSFTHDDIDRLAVRLSTFYRNAPPVPLSIFEYRQRLEIAIAANLEELRKAGDVLAREHVDRVHSAQLAFLHRNSPLLDRRVEGRHIIEAHGDLRPEHVFLDANPQIIDCLEFNVDFRTLDPVDELAFFAIECEALDAPEIGTIVFARYRTETADDPSPQLVEFYKCCRAALRSKLSIWHLWEPQVRDPARWLKQARSYLDLAATYAERLSSEDVPAN
jgi:aminoglycoside phosphotransferase family enzyme